MNFSYFAQTKKSHRTEHKTENKEKKSKKERNFELTTQLNQRLSFHAPYPLGRNVMIPIFLQR